MHPTAPAQTETFWTRYLPGLPDRWWNFSSTPAWSATLDQVISELSDLNRSTERDFLDIGGSLEGLLQAARRIATDMTGLAGQMGGDRSEGADQALTGVLECAGEMREKARRSQEAMAGLRDAANVVRAAFARFHEAISMFRVLGTLTRIETSRLQGSSEFGDLSGEVKALAGSIEERVTGVLDAVERLTVQLGATLQTVSDLEARELVRLPEVTRDVLASLSAFRRQRLECKAVSTRLASQFEAAARSIEEMVCDIQFHDITRQQIQHVVEALEALRGNSGSKGRMTAAGRRIVKLQSLQLAASRSSFTASAERIRANLDEIASRVGEMASESAQAMGMGSRDRESFFAGIERGLSAILEGFTESNSAETAARGGVRDLFGMVTSIQAAAAEIYAVDLEIHRMALNASIRASHLGAVGDPLARLAAAMQDLAMAEFDRSQHAAETLQGMTDAATRLSALFERDSAGTQREAVTRRMRASAGELHSATESAFSRALEVNKLAADLRDDIDRAQQRFTADRTVVAVIDRCRESLNRLVELAGSGELSEGNGAPGDAVESCSVLYTMQSEREVHAALAGHSPAAMEELGSNVELF